MSATDSNLWLEFLGPDGLREHCGLCGNTGWVDTRGKVSTPAGAPCGVLRPCICPNGRSIAAAARPMSRRIEVDEDRVAAAIATVLEPLEPHHRALVIEHLHTSTGWCRHCMAAGCRGACENDE